jgi:hypothetical protein
MRRILVVDDDPHVGVAIRATVQRGLNARGSMKAEAARR